MTLKLQLLKDDSVVFELPLEMNNWNRKQIEKELKLVEHEMRRICAIHEMLSSETRIRMLNNIIRNIDVRFSKLTDELEVNQKIVNENLERLRNLRLINRYEKNPREVHYTASKLGFASLLTMAAIRRVVDELEAE